MKMLKMLPAILAAALFASTAMAAPQSATPADTETIVVSKAYDLLNALNAIGVQHEELVGQGPTQKVIAMPYYFSADTLWAIADNVTALRKVATTFEETRRQMQLAAEAKNGGALNPSKDAAMDANGNIAKPEVPSPEQRALAEAIQKLFESERPVAKLFRIKRGDLCLGGKSNSPDCPKDAANKIPPGVISLLDPILER